MEKPVAILYKDMSELPIIEELASFMKKQNFRNLDELIKYSVPELQKMEGFGYRCLKDLYQILGEELLKED
jgi:hypothetical protein